MNHARVVAAAMAAVLLGAAPRHVPPTAYSAPAGNRPAGASPGHPADAVLPDGRIASPVGATIFVGTNPQSIALAPGGRFAVVANDEQDAAAPSGLPVGAGPIVAGYSLTVVDTRTMRVASVYQAPGVGFFEGLVALRDPAHPGVTIVLASDGAAHAVRVFDLDSSGTLQPETASIVLGNDAYPASIDVSADGRTAYVADNLGDTVAAIDIAQRRLTSSVQAGFFPLGVALAGSRAYVTNGGLGEYRALAHPMNVPQFAKPAGHPYKSSSLSVFDLDSSGKLIQSANTVRLDPVPDGNETVGGARPGAIVTRKDGRFAYVALSNVDRVATVALGAAPHVVAGLDLRLFINAPYGTQPSAEVLSRDGKRLYVALAGLNAVAVLDSHEPQKLHRLGLIPTGWYPSALALSSDGRYLYVTSAKGVDGWGMLQRIDMRKLPLVNVTLSALRYNRSVAAARYNPEVPTIRSRARSNVIDRVVYISFGTAPFDGVFGEANTADPNVRALAHRYALARNFYVNDVNLDANDAYALGGMATLFTQQTLPVNAGRAPLDEHGVDPEDYPRAGYVFNAAARAGLSYRDYGALLDLSGFRDTAVEPAHGRGARAVMPPLGGVYTLDGPALAALDGHIDLDYPGSNAQIPDMKRADEFIADMGRLVQNDEQPAFTYVRLPVAGGGIGDADRALGRIVAFLSQTPHWSSTAIFIVGQGVDGSPDRINRAHSYALVVSPLAKRGYVGPAHLSVASVVKTEEELLGLPPLALPDLLSTDMADFFGTVPYSSPYHALP